VPNKINTYAKQDQHFAVMLNKINTAMPSKINTFAVMLNKINTFEVMLNRINTHYFTFLGCQIRSTLMPSKINTFAVMLNKLNTFEVMLNKINTHFLPFFTVPSTINTPAN